MTTYEELRTAADAVWAAVDRPPHPVIQVGIATCTIAHGAPAVLERLRNLATVTGADCEVGITSCYGFCFAEPTVTVTYPDGPRVLYGPVTVENVEEFFTSVTTGDRTALALGALRGRVPGVAPIEQHVFSTGQVRRLMALLGVIDPENIDHAIANDAYAGIARALRMSPDDVIKTVSDSGLWGRGGAAFPTGRKWEFLKVARATPKYIVCNADEGDPGAWVNRELMEGDPHAVIEGMIAAGHASGAEFGYIYIRDEYPLAVARETLAVQQARERGVLGKNIFGSGTNFDIRVVRGAGSYVCGEETGLISSIQDSRGMPRIKPPFPANAGLWGLPTNVNNLETLASVPFILRHGAQIYRQQGTQRNTGTKMFSLSGDITRVGVVEVPLGAPVRQLVEVNGGGIPNGRPLKGIQPGGPLGGILRAQGIELDLEPEPFRAMGVLMGGGGLVIFDDSTCMVDFSNYFTWFAEDESCGRCTTCHGGTQRLTEILRRIQSGGGRLGDLELMAMIGDTLQWSNCVHGQAAPTAVKNCLANFRDEFLTHIVEKRCPAQVCRGLIRYQVRAESQTDRTLERAVAICPTAAVKQAEGRYYIDDALCIRCGACKEQCPTQIDLLDAFPAEEKVALPPSPSDRIPVAALAAGH